MSIEKLSELLEEFREKSARCASIQTELLLAQEKLRVVQGEVAEVRTRARRVEKERGDTLRNIRELADTMSLEKVFVAGVGHKDQGPPDFSTSVQSLGLPRRTVNCLMAENIFDLGELIQRTPSELRKVPNLGAKTMGDIEEAVRGLGLSLGMKLTDWTHPEAPATDSD